MARGGIHLFPQTRKRALVIEVNRLRSASPRTTTGATVSTTEFATITTTASAPSTALTTETALASATTTFAAITAITTEAATLTPTTAAATTATEPALAASSRTTIDDVAELHTRLLLLLALALRLSARASDEILALLALKRLALRELLRRALVSFPCLQATTKLEFLLRELGEILGVALRLVFWLRGRDVLACACDHGAGPVVLVAGHGLPGVAVCIDGGRDDGIEAFFFFFFSDGFAGFFIGPFARAGCLAPAVGGLLFVLAADAVLVDYWGVEGWAYAMPVRLWRSSRPVRVPRPP